MHRGRQQGEAGQTPALPEARALARVEQHTQLHSFLTAEP
jgi:hypothetical protein